MPKDYMEDMRQQFLAPATTTTTKQEHKAIFAWHQPGYSAAGPTATRRRPLAASTACTANTTLSSSDLQGRSCTPLVQPVAEGPQLHPQTRMEAGAGLGWDIVLRIWTGPERMTAFFYQTATQMNSRQVSDVHLCEYFKTYVVP
eukprot:1161272-Pelagomonas_calceolata.AAC.1